MANIFADDLYDRLGVERGASTEEVKRAYRRLLRLYPPERAQDEFMRILEAYETLSRSESRREYDSQLSGEIRSSLDAALAAMRDKRYDEAERHFKWILIQQPDLGFVRNHLGLCYLYQGRGAEAAAQYERLMQAEGTAAHVYVNAGHAYRMAQRGNDAIRAFRRAIQLSMVEGENPTDCYLGIADVHVAQKQYEQARRILEEGIRANGKVDFEDVQLFAKLLEIHIIERDLPGTERVLQRIRALATDDDQARFLAWKLGVLCKQLIELNGFEYALRLAEVARSLQPSDADYVALASVAQYLLNQRFDEAMELVKTHPAFRDRGWLRDTAPAVAEYCRQNRVSVGLKPIKRSPSLSTTNGIGTMLYGSRDRDAATQSYIATLYFVVLFIPLFPIACYRVIKRGDRSWSFLGKVPFSQREKTHLGFAVVLLIMFVFRGFLPGPQDILGPSYAGSGGPEVFPAPAEHSGSAPAVAAAIPPDPAPTDSHYRGTVYNALLPDDRGSLVIDLHQSAQQLTGHYQSVGGPLGGSGSVSGEISGDSIHMRTISVVGDTVTWRGVLAAGRLTGGTYLALGGQYFGQYGKWNASFAHGEALRTSAAAPSESAAPGAASAPSAPSTATPLPATATSGPENGPYAAERGRIQAMERRYKQLSADLDRRERQLKTIANRIHRIEQDARDGLAWNEGEYETLLARHNRLVEVYNARLDSGRALYARYKAAVDAYNAGQ